MVAFDERNAHRPYLAAIVDELDAAGVDVAAWEANTNDPRDGSITLDADITRAEYDEAEVVLCWSEERGWWRGYESDDGLRDVRAADLGVLPYPDEVVAWAREVTVRADPRSEPGVYRAFEDQDGFESRLHAYWPPTDQVARS